MKAALLANKVLRTGFQLDDNPNWLPGDGGETQNSVSVPTKGHPSPYEVMVVKRYQRIINMSDPVPISLTMKLRSSFLDVDGPEGVAVDGPFTIIPGYRGWNIPHKTKNEHETMSMQSIWTPVTA